MLFLTENYQFKKKHKKFIESVKSSKIYEDDNIIEFYIDFIKIAKIDLSGQDVFIKLVDFPYVLDWQEFIYKQKSDVSILNDFIGYAAGMNNDDKVEIYINKKDWDLLDYDKKRILIYHELCHDIFNLEHTNRGCGIMSPAICDFENEINLELKQLLNEQNLY
jgi:hypothetical protein